MPNYRVILSKTDDEWASGRLFQNPKTKEYSYKGQPTKVHVEPDDHVHWTVELHHESKHCTVEFKGTFWGKETMTGTAYSTCFHNPEKDGDDTWSADIIVPEEIAATASGDGSY